MDLDIMLSNKGVLNISTLHNSIQLPSDIPSNILNEEYEWLKKVQSAVYKEALEKDEWISWAAYNALASWNLQHILH
jgi:hypothetical protein